LSSKELKLKKKSENVAGLQVVDLLAHAIRDDVLCDYARLDQPRGRFDARLLGAVRGKYHRRMDDGRVEGYGKVLVPRLGQEG